MNEVIVGTYWMTLVNVIFLGAFAIFVQPTDLCFIDLVENQ